MNDDAERLVESFKDDVIPTGYDDCDTDYEYTVQERVQRAREQVAYWNGVLDGLGGLK